MEGRKGTMMCELEDALDLFGCDLVVKDRGLRFWALYCTISLRYDRVTRYNSVKQSRITFTSSHLRPCKSICDE
jgi:hypothetical protein